MRGFVFARVKFADDQPTGAMEAEILKQLLEFELSRQDLKRWQLSSGGIELATDFASYPPAIEDFEKRRAADSAKAERWLRNTISRK